MLRLEREDLRPDARLWGNLLALGTPVAMQNMAISVGGMIVQRVVNGFEVAFIAGFTAGQQALWRAGDRATSFGYADDGLRRAEPGRAPLRAHPKRRAHRGGGRGADLAGDLRGNAFVRTAAGERLYHLGWDGGAGGAGAGLRLGATCG